MQERKELGIECDELFVVKNDRDWCCANVSTLNSYAKSFSKIMGIDFYFHSCRHYFTTALSKANIPAEVIKKISGWDSVEMVSRYDDTEIDESLGKYFDENGIRKIEKRSIEDL
jgi:integrase